MSLTFPPPEDPAGNIYLHGAAVALLPSLQEAVPTDRRSHQAAGARFIQDAAGAAARQVLLIVVGAAAAEGPRNNPAEETHQSPSVQLDKANIGDRCLIIHCDSS